MAKQGSSAGILTSSIVTNLIKIAVPLMTFAWGMSNPVGKVSNIGSGLARTVKIASAPLVQPYNLTNNFKNGNMTMVRQNSSYDSLQNSRRRRSMEGQNGNRPVRVVKQSKAPSIGVKPGAISTKSRTEVWRSELLNNSNPRISSVQPKSERVQNTHQNRNQSLQVGSRIVERNSQTRSETLIRSPSPSPQRKIVTPSSSPRENSVRMNSGRRRDADISKTPSV